MFLWLVFCTSGLFRVSRFCNRIISSLVDFVLFPAWHPGVPSFFKMELRTTLPQLIDRSITDLVDWFWFHLIEDRPLLWSVQTEKCRCQMALISAVFLQSVGQYVYNQCHILFRRLKRTRRVLTQIAVFNGYLLKISKRKSIRSPIHRNIKTKDSSFSVYLWSSFCKNRHNLKENEA